MRISHKSEDEVGRIKEVTVARHKNCKNFDVSKSRCTLKDKEVDPEETACPDFESKRVETAKAMSEEAKKMADASKEGKRGWKRMQVLHKLKNGQLVHEVAKGELEEVQKPYATTGAIPQALRTAGLNLSQANYWAKIYDGAKASGSKFAGAIAWTGFKKKYRKVGTKWVLRRVQKDFTFLDQVIAQLEKAFRDFEVEEQDEVPLTDSDEPPLEVDDESLEKGEELKEKGEELKEKGEELKEKGEELKEKGEKFEKEFIPILKVDHKKHVVYGVVLEPEVFDAQQDIASLEEIEKAAHEFLAFYRKIDLRHHYVTEKCYPVESYLAPQDIMLGGQKVKEGSWILGTKVTDPKIWKDIEKGVLTGFSIVGYAQRVLEE